MYSDKVIKGNTLDILRSLPENIVDMGVTSPPYNKGENKKGWLVQNVKYASSSDKLPEDVYQSNQKEVLNELFRIIKPGGSFFYNHKIRWERGDLIHPMDWLRQSNWTIRQEIIWDRQIAANIRGWRFWQVEERIYWLYKPVDHKNIGTEILPKHAKLTSIWRFPPERNNDHPAPFPLELPTRAILSIMDDKQGLIIDPYSGSGTTLVAAKLLGHKYLGVEISPEYVAASEIRLENCENERTNITIEIGKHSISKTFSERKQNGAWAGKFKPSPAAEEPQAILRLFEPKGKYE